MTEYTQKMIDNIDNTTTLSIDKLCFEQINRIRNVSMLCCTTTTSSGRWRNSGSYFTAFNNVHFHNGY